MQILFWALVSSFCLFTQSADVFAKNTDEYHPQRFFDSRIRELKNQILARPGIASPEAREVRSGSTRNEWLKKLYGEGLVEASELTRLLSDKAIMAGLLESFLGKESEAFHPKTMGLKYFLAKHALVDAKGVLQRDEAKIKAALAGEFPHGYIVKPAAGINSEGKSKGFYFKMDKFLADLVREDSPVYSPADFQTPFVSPLLGVVASGEMLILQENVVLAAGAESPLTTKEFAEVRAHTFEDKLVAGATYSRWAESKVKVTKEHFRATDELIQALLAKLPKEFLARQAFSIDVAVLANGYTRILDVNTNRGREIQWSGYMPRPGVIGAYTRHLEAEKKLHFAGLNGALLRSGWGNYLHYLKKVYVEGIY